MRAGWAYGRPGDDAGKDDAEEYANDKGYWSWYSASAGPTRGHERVGEARVGRSRHAFSPTVCNCSPSYAAARKEPITNRLTRAELAPHGLRPRKTLAL
jgi:hypothetical protein